MGVSWRSSAVSLASSKEVTIKTISKEATRTSFIQRVERHTVVHPDNEEGFSAIKT